MAPAEPAGVASVVRARLAAELDRDLAVASEIARRVSAFSAPAHDARDEPLRASALAFEIERFYTAVESMLERILRTLDGDIPSGPSSHVELLRAASVEVRGLRPAVLDVELENELRVLLRFRHYARHGYAEAPEPARLSELAGRVARVDGALPIQLNAFRARLLAPGE